MRLSRELTEMNIPNKRGNSFSLRISNPTPETAGPACNRLRAFWRRDSGCNSSTGWVVESVPEEVAAEYEPLSARN